MRPLILTTLIFALTATAQTALAQAEAERPKVAPQVTAPLPEEDAPIARPGRERDDRVPNTVELVTDVMYAEAPGAENADGPAGESIPLLLDAAFLKQSDGQPMPVIIYIHGGGYVSGSKDAGMPFMTAFALGGYFTVSINYRLADVAKYPAAVHDCKAAVRFIRANAEQLGIDPNRIGVWGHSAGGHLSALLGTSGNTDVLDGRLEPADVSSAVNCVVTVSGPTDFLRMSSSRSEGFETRWFGSPVHDVPDKARQASPITHADAADPAFLIVHGTADNLVPIEQATLLSDALKNANVKVELLPIENAGHAIREPEAYAKIAEFFDKRLRGNAAQAYERLNRRNEVDPDPMPDPM